MRASRGLSGALVVAAGLLLVGCSESAPDKPELGTVHGTITLDGVPLAGVSVYFKPDVGRPSIGTADDLGVYRAKYLIDEEGVKVGPCTVTVEWGMDESGPPIPPKYGAKTELKLDVQAGDNEFNIDMQSS